MSEADAPSIPLPIVDRAIDWAVKLNFGEPDPAAQRAFEQWLQADPLHGQAWRRIQSMRAEFSGVPSRLALDTLQSADALRAARARKRRQVLRMMALAGVSVVAASGVRELAPWQRWVADASTATGEQRTLRLADGTTLVLNTDTAVGIALEADRRVITLRRGEILVTTGHDDRPFWVRTPSGSMRALGTRFMVRLDGDRSRVSVQEGAVALHPGGGGAGDIARPGTTWWLAEDSVALAPAQPFAADGWAEGVIAGNDMRLADVLAELARYRTGRLVCDPRVANLRVSGAYHVDDTDRALAFLSQTLPVKVSHRTRFWVVVGPQDGSGG